jgi:hypothetical protein
MNESPLSSVLPKLRTLHYLFSHSSTGNIIAHCLDFDIVAAGKELEEVDRKLSTLVKLYIESSLAVANYSALNTKAPERYWAVFQDAWDHARIVKSTRLTFRLPEILPLEYPESQLGILAAMAATTPA